MTKFMKILVLMIVFSFVLCSCGGTVEEVIPEYEFTVSDKTDLEGANMTIGWAGITGDTVLGFAPGTANADYALERKKNIEDSMNCKINIIYNNDILPVLETGVMSGAQTLDLVKHESYFLVVDIRAGYLSGLSQYLDVNDYEKYGTPNMLQSVMWQDDLYAVTPYAWPELLYSSPGHVITVNENFISRLGQTDPRDYVENGEWTWDLFEDLLPVYTHEDNGNKVYAIKCHDAYFAMNMLLSNGVAVSEFKDGQVVCGAYTPEGIAALERARSIMLDTCADCFHPSQSAADPTEFYRGECVMYCAWAYELTRDVNSIMFQMDNVALLPFPQGPNAKPGVYLSYHESLPNSIGIPFNAKDPASSALVLSALLEPFEDFPTKDSIIEYMTAQTFFDRRDTEVLANLTRNTEYGFFREGARGVIQSATETTTPISTLLESNQKVYDQIVEDFMTPHYQARVAVYGE
jgi:ABC-type glycerol-3-phosphate transport system substrate-binding protein